MDQKTCPKCDGVMSVQHPGGVRVLRCDSCLGVFLDRVDVGSLVEAENDWHANRSHDTAQLPRITADMTAPPTPKSRAWVESLFQ
jgi:Zn-finger nucleic acid-binding protein